MQTEEPALKLYLVRCVERAVLPKEAGGFHRLAPNFHLARSRLSQSQLYHLIKRNGPPGAPLLVATLDGPPKFKGMEDGALAFIRGADRRGAADAVESELGLI